MAIEAYSPRPIGTNWLSCFVCDGIKDGYSESQKNGPEGEVVKSTLEDDGIHYRGQYYSCQPDMAAHVDDKAAGERVVKMFNAEGCKAFLDFRPKQPNYVQVKVGACETHLPNLEELQRLASQNNVISRELIRQAKELKD